MLNKNWIKNWIARSKGVVALLAITLAASATIWGSTPNVTVSTLTTIPTSGMTAPEEFVQDTCGNYYVMDATSQLWEIPSTGGAATSVAYDGYGMGWANHGLAIDSNNSLYITAPNYGGNLLKIPSINCVPQTGSESNVALPGATQSYWYFAEGIAVDANNTLFLFGSNNQIMEYTSTGNLSTLLNTSCLPSAIVVDAAENLYFTCGANPATGGNGNSNNGVIYKLAYTSGAYASAATTFATTSLTNAYGMTFDKAGNLYIVDQGTSILYKMPINPQTATLDPTLIYAVGSAPAFSYKVKTAQDGKTLLYAPGYSSGDTNLYTMVPGEPNFGSVALGSNASRNVNFAFDASLSPATISVTSPSGVFTNTWTGSCYANTWAAGKYCTVNVKFAPALPGVATGSVLLLDSNGDQLATADISGIGAGAGLTIDPGVATSFGSGYSAPAGAAVDYAGNLFFADSVANAVWEVAAGTTTAKKLANGFNAPKGVAVDGAGNVYVADTGNNQIVEIPVVNGVLTASAESTVLASTTNIAGAELKAPAGIAIDASGNLYIADSGNKRVLEVPYNGAWNFSATQTLGSGMTTPAAVAVDASGNVYVADSGSGKLIELVAPLSSGTQVTVGSGYSQPSGLAVDPSGAIFIVDQGNTKVWRIPNLSGTPTAASAVNVSGQVNAAGTSIIANPFGVAIDGVGNLYVSDNKNGAAYKITRLATSQAFGIWNPGATSSVLTSYVENSGNSALTLASPFATASGNTAVFSTLSSGTNLCTNSSSIASGSSCNLETQFASAAEGTFAETLTLNSNASNATGQNVAYSATSALTVATTTTLAITSPASGSPSYDQAVTLQATVSSANGVPAGSVSLSVDGIVKQTVSLSNGVATFTLTGGSLTGGTHILSAAYSGGTVGFTIFAQSASNVLNPTVQPVASSTALAVPTLYVSPVSQPAAYDAAGNLISANAIQLTSTITSAYAGSPTGSVTFTIKDSGHVTTTLTVPLTAQNAGLVSGQYLPLAPATGVAYDVVSITAAYSGDENYLASTSTITTINVSPAIGSAQLVASSTSLTSSAYNPATTITFTANSYGGWTGVIGFSCDPSTLPANAVCVFSPGQLSLQPNTAAVTYNAQTTQLTVTVNNPPQTPSASSMIWWMGAASGLLLYFVRRRYLRGAWSQVTLMIAGLLLAASATGLTACNSTAANQTPVGNSTVTVYANADPYQSGSTTATQSCGTTTVGGVTTASPALSPCSQQSFKVSLTVQ